MRAGLIAATAALVLAGGAAGAQERDAPPPGCRWIGDDLGCRDGRGNYRRAGDGEIIGTYPVSKPKPKPSPRPEAAAVPTETPPSAGDIVAGAAANVDGPPADTPFALTEDGAAQAMQAPAPDPALAAPEPPAAQPAPARPKPWWQAFWDWLVNDILGLLRRLGLAT